MMESLATIVNNIWPFTVVAKIFILNDCGGPGYGTVNIISTVKPVSGAFQNWWYWTSSCVVNHLLLIYIASSCPHSSQAGYSGFELTYRDCGNAIHF